MKTLNEYLQEARAGKYATGHFNFATADVLKAVVMGAMDAGAPAVMVGTSEGEAKFFGMPQAVALVRVVREELDFPVFLNADHHKSVEKCKEVIDFGYDSVIIDTSKLSYEENVSAAKEVVQYAHSQNRDVSVEGELGYLKGSSEVQGSIEISKDDYTKPELAADFVSKTGVDRLAIVFGNVHGIVTEQEVHLDIEQLRNIVSAIPDTHIVLHGASGFSDEEVMASIKNGITNVHFNTELRVAYAKAIDDAFHGKDKQETTPYKYLGPADKAVRELVAHKTKMFMGK